MHNLAEKKDCTACGACLNICPQNAIKMEPDKYGFMYHFIDKTLCSNCGLCEKACLDINKLIQKYPLDTIAAQSRDTDLLLKSSSGGLFGELARHILKQNGIVYGASQEYSEESFNVSHVSIESEDNLNKLQGSKYVQSQIAFSYKETKQYLHDGRKVLFSGTPCQIAGLKAFLGKDYDNLLTVDLSCTGVPNEKLFNDYIKFLEKKLNNKIFDIHFRNKKIFGWACRGYYIKYAQNNKTYKEKIIYRNVSSYPTLFISGKIFREGCYNCKYANLNRISDITLGDCWGIEVGHPKLLKENGGILDRKKGISLVLINTQKGSAAIDNIKSDLLLQKIDIDKVKQYNSPLNKPPSLSTEREEYLNAYMNFGYDGIEELFNKYGGWQLKYNRIKNFTPEWIKNIVRFFKYKRFRQMFNRR